MVAFHRSIFAEASRRALLTRVLLIGSQRMVAQGSSFKMVAGEPRPTSKVAAVAVSQGERSNHSTTVGTSEGPKRRMSPDVAREMAQSPVAALEKALEAMGDGAGPVVEVLKAELTEASLESNLWRTWEIDQCRKSIARSERRIKELDSQSTEMCPEDRGSGATREVVGAQSRGSTIQPQDRGSQVTSESQHIAGRTRCSGTRPGRQSPRTFASGQETSSCEAGEFISRFSWSHPFDAQARLQRRDVVVAGPTSRLPTVRDHHNPAIFRGPHGDDVNAQVGLVSRVIDHKCGFQGCRVGEASNPGQLSRTREGGWRRSMTPK